MNVISRENGYTLLETLVAMALFLSVLIPLGVTIGNLLLNDSAKNLALALHAGQSEMNRIIAEHDYTNASTTDDHGFMIQREIHLSGNMVDVSLIISSTNSSHKKILSLHKTVLTYK